MIIIVDGSKRVKFSNTALLHKRGGGGGGVRGRITINIKFVGLMTLLKVKLKVERGPGPHS